MAAVTSSNDSNLRLLDRIGFRLDDAVTPATNVVQAIGERGTNADNQYGQQHGKGRKRLPLPRE